MKRVSSRRAKACAISQPVRERVYSRDGYECKLEGPECVHRQMLTPAHVVSRAKGGLGIEQNLITGCIPCHDILDHGTREEREAMYDKARDYLRGHYPNLDEINVIYSKYGN